jgi:hypothetical protein
MSMGQAFKNGFSMLMNVHGTDVLIHKDYGRQNQGTRQVRGIKSSEKNKPEKVMFFFPEVEDINIGDVLQVKAGRDLWQVTETEDTIHGDVLTNFAARVKKLNGAAEPRAKSPNSLVIHGDVYGAVQIGNEHSSQSVSVQLSQVDRSISELQKMIPQTAASELDKEEALHALDRLTQLSKKEKSPDVIAKAKDKLEIVKNVIGTAVDLGKIATPYIAILGSHFAQ